jgi:hypothetical protein
VPLDASLIKGSHGRVERGSPYAPVLLADGLDHLDAGPHPVTAVHDAMVHLVEHT